MAVSRRSGSGGRKSGSGKAGAVGRRASSGRQSAARDRSSKKPRGGEEVAKAEAAEDTTVVMINLISVPAEQADEFLRGWDRITEYMRRQPGFLRANLYRRFDNPERWVNVAVFESTEAIRAAFSTREIDRLTEGYPGHRDVGLYAQIRTVQRSPETGSP